MLGACRARYRALLLDLGGVVWRDYRPIWENLEALRVLQETGVKLVAVTNNSTRSRLFYSERLRELGLDVPPGRVVTSGYAAAVFLGERMPGARVYVVGEEGLRSELAGRGLRVLRRCGEAEAVVVGLDRRITYGKIHCASRLVRRGAFFLATNTDPTRPMPGGEEAPSAGSMVAAVSVAAGRGPGMVAGKPSPWIVGLALRVAGVDASEALIVGDRVETDVVAGIRAGVDTLLLETGVRNRGALRPTYSARSLWEALPLILDCG